jgi:histidinol dehydrogenase
MRIVDADDTRAIDRLVRVDRARDPRVARTAARIVADVRARGDRAVLAWSRRLDGLTRIDEIDLRERQRACDRTPPVLRRAIAEAVRNVRAVAMRQLPRPFRVDVRPGVRIEQRVEPIARVGCYVPAGRHPLPSSLIMCAIPAAVAGVKDIVVVCPRPDDVVLCASVEAGAHRVLRVGGAQAIAALAFGTASIPRVDKIVGPGNAWVAAAKAIVAGDVGVDGHAGPSEIVVWSSRGRRRWIAADLAAQAEHDPDARAIFVTTSRQLAAGVAADLAAFAPAGSVGARALARHGAIVIARSRRAAIDLVNRLAPEHLVCDDEPDARECTTAGSVFVGDWSAQAAGDYCTGSNHVLPTGGTARYRGGLSTADFVRTCTIQTLTRRGLTRLAPATMALATAEGLDAHAASIRVRMEDQPV